MVVVAIVAALVVGWLASGWYSSRRLPARSARGGSAAELVYLLVCDGRNFNLYPASWSDVEQTEVIPHGGGVPFPRGGVEVVQAGRLTLCVAAFSPAVLAEHATIRQARKNVDLSAMFKGGGDSRKFWQMAGAIVPLVVVVLMWWQSQGAAAQQAEILQSVGAVHQVVSQPLACKVVD